MDVQCAVNHCEGCPIQLVHINAQGPLVIAMQQVNPEQPSPVHSPETVRERMERSIRNIGAGQLLERVVEQNKFSMPQLAAVAASALRRTLIGNCSTFNNANKE